MSLARITEKIEANNNKEYKIDVRRFNIRSKRKELWQLRDIQKSFERHELRSNSRKDDLKEYRHAKVMNKYKITGSPKQETKK